MKQTFIFILTVLSVCAFAQVAIGKDSVTNNSVSLEFGTGSKGIVLPWVTSSAGVSGVVDGTIIYDITDHKVKYRKLGSWFDLSVDKNGAADTTLQDTQTENPSAKTAIGANGATDATPGILVLTDSDKAMVLPKVANPHLMIKNPASGMMVYDTANRQLAVFNGAVWTFWKP
ncbi:hypothetical protein J2X97_002016 [Epilithonimonas hungarica]|uniref:hypothetical protein n=1 Tax=Epilithonimonas hungarica TaxID=454006 RepID=UPI0027815D4B|nr:hypothetical protein [Epilithonimonas hungarica]MDP9956379.1 hypothetical protein [Epilithonimonas hungarica]